MIHNGKHSTPKLTRRELLYFASLGLLSFTGFGCNEQPPSVGKTGGGGKSPFGLVTESKLKESITAKGMNALGSDLSFVGTGVQASSLWVPYPILHSALQPIGIALNLVGGLCSAIGGNISLRQALDPNTPVSQATLFDPGQGVSRSQRDMLREYGNRNGWHVASDYTTLVSVQRKSSQFAKSVEKIDPGPCASPLFIAKNSRGKLFYFQFLDDVHIRYANSKILTINDGGHVFIFGHGGQVYRCRIRVLAYLLEEDACSWTVLSDTQSAEPCSKCGCPLFLQEFTNEEPKSDKYYKKLMRFALRTDPRFLTHQNQCVRDDSCETNIPCGTEIVDMG